MSGVGAAPPKRRSSSETFTLTWLWMQDFNSRVGSSSYFIFWGVCLRNFVRFDVDECQDLGERRELNVTLSCGKQKKKLKTVFIPENLERSDSPNELSYSSDCKKF